jgi:hypothetical protein
MTELLNTAYGMRQAAYFTRDFWNAVGEGSIDEAESMIHPDSALSGDELENYLSTLEKENNLDFSDNLWVLFDDSHTMISADKNFERAYVTECVIVINNTSYLVSMLTLDDERGFGIYRFSINNI